MKMTLGNVDLYYNLRFEDTAKWFRWHMLPEAASEQKPIVLSDELFQIRKPEFIPGTPDGYIEYRTLVEDTGRALCEQGVFIIHAVAFSWNNYAWLFTAPSGTGKTTQYRNWKQLWPDEVQILCGDMPVLRTDEKDDIWVCPSPWNGKERLGFDAHSDYPLGGVVWLRQSEENHMSPVNIHEMVWPVWHQFIGQCNTELQIRSRERFENLLLQKYPVWLLKNRGDSDSARLARNTFESYLKGGPDN